MNGKLLLSLAGTKTRIQSKVNTFLFQTLIKIIQKKKPDIHCLYKQKIANKNLVIAFYN
jgi:hypothetical protein